MTQPKIGSRGPRYEQFFDGLADQRVPLGDLDQIRDWDDLRYEQLEDFVASGFPDGVDAADRPDGGALRAGLVASTSVSGGRYPCSAMACRQQAAALGARFAALYADKIFVRDPFEGREHSVDEWHRRDSLISSLAVAYQWRPLFEAGVAQHLARLCRTCAQTRLVEKGYSDEAGEVRSRLVDELSQKIAFTVERSDGEIRVEFCAPEYYFGHDSITQSLHPKSPLVKGVKRLLGRRRSRDLTLSEAKELGLLDESVDNILTEFSLQALYTRSLASGFVSNKRLDIDLASQHAPKGTLLHARSLIGAVSHAVPIVTNVPVEAIVRLRQEETAAFELYRGRIRSLRKSTGDNYEEIAEELKHDFARLTQDLKAHKRTLLGSAKNSLTVAAGTVGVALAGNLASFWEAGLTAIFAATGGAAVLREVGSAVAGRRRSADSERNPLYFLWRLQNKGSR